MIHPRLKVAETIVKAGPFPFDNLSEPESIHSWPEIKYAKNEEDFNDKTVQINLESSSLKQDEFRSSNNLELQLTETHNQMIRIDNLIFENSEERMNLLIAIVLRKETSEYLEAISMTNNPEAVYHIMLKSQNYLYTFANLVSQNLISLANNKFIITDLCKRIISDVAEGQYD